MRARRAGSNIPNGNDLLQFAANTCESYEKRGFRLTLRQLYYQGVASAFLPSGQPSYDALLNALATARLAGKFPLDAIDDRTRVVHPGQSTRCDVDVDNALRRAATQVREMPERFLATAHWYRQPVHVSVWFEKDALANVFEDVCQKLGVSWFACKGDPSHAALYSWLVQATGVHGIDNENGWRDRNGTFHRGKAQRSVVLYFGDHDPTGIRIPRTAETTLRRFMEITGAVFPLKFVRVGVTLEQAREMNLPPFPAKQSAGTDYDNYVSEFGTDDAWELDALPPERLQEMTIEAVNHYFDKDIFTDNEAHIAQRRQRMKLLMRDKAWHLDATDFGD